MQDHRIQRKELNTCFSYHSNEGSSCKACTCPFHLLHKCKQELNSDRQAEARLRVYFSSWASQQVPVEYTLKAQRTEWELTELRSHSYLKIQWDAHRQTDLTLQSNDSKGWITTAHVHSVLSQFRRRVIGNWILTLILHPKSCMTFALL